MSYPKKIALAVFIIALASIPLAHAQSSSPAFEVASVKPAKPDAAFSGNCHGTDFPQLATTTVALGRCVFNGVTLRQLVRIAYRLELQEGMSDSDLVTGVPPWATSERFDVDGKAEAVATVKTKELYSMLQTLLADRFKLALHRDHKEVQGYALVVAKNGPKLKPDTSGDEHGSLLPSGLAPFEWAGKNVPMSGLASSLSGLFQAPLTDRTGLTGRYTFTLRYAALLPPGAAPRPFAQDVPSIFEALPEQLGLRLEREKASVVTRTKPLR